MGPVALNAALLVAGLGVLRGLGVLPRLKPGLALAAGGLAYLVGVAAVFQVCILLLVLGLPFGLPMIAATCLCLTLGLWRDTGALVRLRRPRGPEYFVRWILQSADRRVAAIVLVAFSGLLVIGLFTVGNTPIGPQDYDAWNLWGRKAGLLLFGSHLPLAVLSSQASGYIHPDYPFVLPLLEAANLRALGRYDLGSVHTVVWILSGAFVWAGGFVASRITRAAIWALLLTGAVALTSTQLLTAYADVPMAFYLCLAVLALGVWLESERREYLVVAAVLLAGAAGIKNEGILGTIVALVACTVTLATTRRHRQLVELGVASLAIVIIAVLPWRLWLAAHGLKGDIPLGSGLDPSFLAGRISRVGPAVNALQSQLVSVSTIAVVVPVALGLAALLIFKRTRTAVVGFYLGAGVLYFAAMVWAYWAGPLEINFWISTSVSRTYLGVAFIALAAVIHLGAPGLRITPQRSAANRGTGAHEPGARAATSTEVT